jgi:hypothetical protein
MEEYATFYLSNSTYVLSTSKLEKNKEKTRVDRLSYERFVPLSTIFQNVYLIQICVFQRHAAVGWFSLCTPGLHFRSAITPPTATI